MKKQRDVASKSAFEKCSVLKNSYKRRSQNIASNHTKTLLLIFLIVLMIVYSFSACGNIESNDKLTLYTTDDTWGGNFVYYEYNKSVKDEADKIEIITFDSVQAMKDRLSSELMAGKGPDIIMDDTVMMAGLSIDKLIDADCFMNFQELNLDLNSYRREILNDDYSGEQQIFIPCFYSPKFWICCEEDIKDFVSGEVITFDELVTLSESTDKKLFPDSDFNDGFILNYVSDNIDFQNKQYNFKGEKFKSTVEALKRLCERENNKQGDEYIFDVYAHGSPYDIYTAFAKIESEGKTPAIVGTPSLNNKLGAYSVDNIFINKNIDYNKTEKIKKFLAFAISESFQNEITGADIEQYNPLFSDTTGNMFPANEKSFEKLMKNADSFSYNTSGDYEPDGGSSPRTDEPQAKISKKSIKLLHEKLENIGYFEMNVYTIGYNVVVQDIISDYYKGEISVDNLISQLDSKTQIYLEE